MSRSKWGSDQRLEDTTPTAGGAHDQHCDQVSDSGYISDGADRGAPGHSGSCRWRRGACWVCAVGASGVWGLCPHPAVSKGPGRRSKAAEHGGLGAAPGPVRTGEFAGPGAAAPGRPGKPAGRGPGGWSGNSPPGDLPRGCCPRENRLCPLALHPRYKLPKSAPTVRPKCLSLSVARGTRRGTRRVFR